MTRQGWTMNWMGRRRGGSVALIALLLGALSPASAPAQSADGPRVAYVLAGSIYTIDAIGGSPARLTESTHDADPTWSPDGSKIAFVGLARAGGEGSLELHTMNADGSGLTQLTNSSSDVRDPSWSADGTHIAFSRSDGNDSEIYVVGLDGSGQQALTDNEFDDLDPAFSPDGARIAFASTRDGVTACERKGTACIPAPELYTMTADGSDQTRITVDIDDDERGCCGSPDYEPTWSPDGTLIAFESHQSNTLGKPYIGVMNSNGTNPGDWVYQQGGAREPSWLPQGRLIAFTAGARDPMVAISSRGCVRVMTPGSSPAWQPSDAGAPEQLCPAPTIAYYADAQMFRGWVDPTGAHYERSRSKNKSLCRQDQTLRLMKRVAGPNRPVATAVTDEDGYWRIPWPSTRRGDFHVKLEPKRGIAPDGRPVYCSGARSVELPVPPIADSYGGPPPVVFTSRGARQVARLGTHGWCEGINYYLSSCLIVDAFGYPFPDRAQPVRAGAWGRITFHRDERPKLWYLRYWREVGEFNEPESQARKITYELRRRPGERFHVWVARFRIPRRQGELFISFGANWVTVGGGTGSGGGDFGLHLEVR